MPSNIIKSLLFLCVYALVCNSHVASYENSAALKYQAQRYYWGKDVAQDYSTALELYLKAARLGDTEAQYIAGGMYYKGYGAKRDIEKAFSLLYRAALLGNSTPESQRILGQFFLTGTTIPRNYEEAVKWYQLAAENGNREAQSELGYFYFIGKGVEQDVKKALFWFNKSARQGLAVAQYSLGIMYYSGNGVEKADPIAAYSWISLAAAQGNRDAIIALDYIENKLQPDELKKAQNMAINLYQEINGE